MYYYSYNAVSILVVMDIELKRYNHHTAKRLSEEVSILVVMDIELKLYAGKQILQKSLLVSILVVMDIELKHYITSYIESVEFPFQSLL